MEDTQITRISYEDFIKVLDFLPSEPEFEFYFKDRKETYSLVKYKDSVSFCRCGYSDEMIKAGWNSDYRGSEEEYFSTFDELYKATVVDGICLKNEWDNIRTIVANNTFNLPDELDDLYRVYGELKTKAKEEK